MSTRRAALLAALAVLAGGAPALAQANNPSFNLVNRSGRQIQEAYASPATDNNWGPDRLGQNVLPNGRSFAIRLPSGECIYDVRVVYVDGQDEERRQINLCQMTDLVFGQQSAAPRGGKGQPGGQPAAAGNPSFHLVNNTGRTVFQLFASPATDNNWGPDRLGNDTVAPGQIFPVRLPLGECVYDVRIVYDNNEAQERRSFDLCEIVNLTIPW